MRQDLFDEFCDEFTREMNRLRMVRFARSDASRGESSHGEPVMTPVLTALAGCLTSDDRIIKLNATVIPKKALALPSEASANRSRIPVVALWRETER